uniref:uncharacterized protein LOC120959519 n=1 Tax=Anopheles coluzzii TaxID=1518534 RepID=UPI0020FFCC41|nr:uncharacterized protein LOC120959519 [Anopheles coluzzii]
MVSAGEYLRTLVVLAAISSLRLVGGAPMRGIGDGGGCRRSAATELPACIGTSIQHFVNFLSSGKLSPRHTITPFDPLLLPNMTFGQAVYVNRYLVGLKNAFIQNVRVDMEKLEFNVTALMPALEMLGMFSMETVNDRHSVTDHSILTFSIRNTAVTFVGKGTLYTATSGTSGTVGKYLRLHLTIPQMVIGGSSLADSDRHLTDASRTVAAAKLKRLIEKDLRLQLAKRIQCVANEALAVTPFIKLFPV